jgi:hypothetical protein
MVFREATQVPLAKDKIRHLGEPIAMVVAESRYIAEDAVGDVVVDFEPLPAVTDFVSALRRDAPRIHEQFDSNLAAHVVQAKGNYAKAAAKAHKIISRELRYDRGIAGAIENRSVVADWNAATEELTICDTSADSDSKRPGGNARLAGIAGACRGALCRRRIRAEDHDVLSGGGSRSVGCLTTGAAREMDRGPARELHRHHAGTRAGA